jgi:hypothetical protein
MIGLKKFEGENESLFSGMIVRPNQLLICFRMIKTIGFRRLFFVTEPAKSSHVAKSQVGLHRLQMNKEHGGR